MGALGFALEPGRFRIGGPPPATAFDFTGGTMPAGATLTRGSPATRFDAAGVLVTAAANVARFDHDPATLALRGLLIEPAATNRLLRSAELGTAPWATSGAITVAGDAGLAPDGSASAELLTLTGGGGAQRYQIYPGGAADVHSIWLRGAAGGEVISLLPADQSTGFGVPLTVTLTTGWTRHAVVSSLNPTDTFILARNNGVGGEAAGSATISFYAWGAQAEGGTSATSLVPTTNASASRSADTLTLGWGTLGVADGSITVRYTFDDLSTQDVTTSVAGGVATVPALNRRRLRRAERIGA